MRAAIRVITLSLVGTTLVLLTVQLFTKSVCERTQTYRIGSIDERFGISRAEFAQDIADAEFIWERPFDHQFFTQANDGEITINLVFDTRQAVTLKEQQLKTEISSTSASAASVRAEYEQLRSSYEGARATYEADLARYDAELRAYNVDVDRWNKKGGAPPSTVATLNATKSVLTEKRAMLDAERAQLQSLGTSVETFVKQYNTLISEINSRVETINNDGLAGTEFEAGLYVASSTGRSITVYQFGSRTALIRTLAHELGHALSLGHIEDRDAIMNPINLGNVLQATPSDIEALRAVCAKN